MKKISSILISVIFSAAICSLVAQPVVKTEQLLKIGEGENFLISESSAGMICSAGELCVTTYNPVSKNFYVYRNGVKNGPYLKNNIEQNMCPAELQEFNYKAYSPVEFNQNDYCEYTDDGRVFINLNGKKYGPYTNLMSLNLSPQKNNFVAVIMNIDMSFTVVSSLCKEFNIDGNFSNISFNQDGTKFLLTINCESDINKIINQKMLSLQVVNYSEEEMMKILQEITDLQNNATEEQNMKKSYIYTESGLVYGPYNSEFFAADNPIFLPESGDNWIMTQSHKLFINGIEVKDFGEDYPNTNNFFLSKDGKNYATWSYDKIIFSDGREYDFPIYVSYCNNQLIWLRLENKTQLIKHSVEF